VAGPKKAAGPELAFAPRSCGSEPAVEDEIAEVLGVSARTIIVLDQNRGNRVT
jgi:hypothetical protein